MLAQRQWHGRVGVALGGHFFHVSPPANCSHLASLLVIGRCPSLLEARRSLPLRAIVHPTRPLSDEGILVICWWPDKETDKGANRRRTCRRTRLLRRGQ